jgi:plasmid stability protein
MAHNITIEDVDPDVINQLQYLAEQHGRSLQAELKHILKAVTQQSSQTLSDLNPSQLDWSVDFFERTAGTWQGDLVREPQGESEQRHWDLM